VRAKRRITETRRQQQIRGGDGGPLGGVQPLASLVVGRPLLALACWAEDWLAGWLGVLRELAATREQGNKCARLLSARSLALPHDARPLGSGAAVCVCGRRTLAECSVAAAQWA